MVPPSIKVAAVAKGFVGRPAASAQRYTVANLIDMSVGGFDGDYIPDDIDEDDDNDGFSDTIEQSLDYDSKDADNVPSDYDLDGMPDAVDYDDDNDGVLDYDDYAPLDKKVQKDPNLYRFWGVEIELGELVVAIFYGHWRGDLRAYCHHPKEAAV